MGYNWQWNVSVQREIARNTTLEVGYVGSKGYDLLLPYDVNQVPLATKRQRRPIARSSTPGSDSDARRGAPAVRRLRRHAASRSSTTRGKTTYHSLQTQLVSRFGHGSQFQASYTLSKTTGDVHADRRRERRRRPPASATPRTGRSTMATR